MEVFRIENATSPKKQKSILEQRSKVLIDRPKRSKQNLFKLFETHIIRYFNAESFLCVCGVCESNQKEN